MRLCLQPALISHALFSKRGIYKVRYMSQDLENKDRARISLFTVVITWNDPHHVLMVVISTMTGGYRNLDNGQKTARCSAIWTRPGS